VFSLISKPFFYRNSIPNSKPVSIAGLLFIIFYLQLLDAHTSISLLTDNLLTNPKLPVITDTVSTCAIRYTFAPLLSEIKTTNSDNYNSQILKQCGQSDILWCNKTVRYHLSYSFTDFNAAYRDDFAHYSFDNVQKQHTLAASTLFTFNNTGIGLLLGRHFSKDLDIEHRYEIADAFSKYLSNGPWIYSLSAEQTINKFHLALTLFSGPVYSSVSRMITRTSGSFRTFPVSLISRTFDLTVDYKVNSLYLSNGFQFSSWHNVDLLETSNSMPQDVELQRYSLFESGHVSIPFSDSLFWNINGSLTGGWIASYNFNRNRFTFFKTDSVRFRSISALCGLTLSRNSSAELFGDFTTFSSPGGTLQLSALSAWSVFSPLDYKYTDVKGDYSEIGIQLHRMMQLSLFSFVPSISCSYVKTFMNLTYSEKEVVVLIPVYVNAARIEPVNKQIIMLTPELSAKATVGRYAFQLKATQLLPIELKKGKTSQSSETADKSGNNRSQRFWGGTSLSFFINYYFGQQSTL
jgi:hypothetical protein